MSKISSPQELTDRLQSILRQASTGVPQRTLIASDLRKLAKDLTDNDASQGRPVTAFGRNSSYILLAVLAEFSDLYDELGDGVNPATQSEFKTQFTRKVVRAISAGVSEGCQQEMRALVHLAEITHYSSEGIRALKRMRPHSWAPLYNSVFPMVDLLFQFKDSAAANKGAAMGLIEKALEVPVVQCAKLVFDEANEVALNNAMPELSFEIRQRAAGKPRAKTLRDNT